MITSLNVFITASDVTPLLADNTLVADNSVVIIKLALLTCNNCSYQLLINY